MTGSSVDPIRATGLGMRAVVPLRNAGSRSDNNRLPEPNRDARADTAGRIPFRSIGLTSFLGSSPSERADYEEHITVGHGKGRS